MILLKLLNGQGLAGLAAAACLAILLVVQKGETRHWRKHSDHFEQLYLGEQAAHARTVAAYRAAADQARQSDAANAARVEAEQATINHRIANDFEDRLADARARYGRLRRPAQDAADPGGGGGAPMPGLSVAAGRPAQAAGTDGLSAGNALIATEQAIQLDELINWIHRQAAIDPNTQAPTRH